MSLPEHQRQIIYYTLIGPSVAGSLGCLFVITVLVSFRTMRSISYMMIGILAGFDLLNALSFVLPTYDAQDEDVLCQMQAVGLNFSTSGGLIWTSFMALYLHWTIKTKEKCGNRPVLWSFFATLIISTILTLIPIIPENDYGKNHGWCWINGKYYIKRYIVFFVPVLLIIPLNLCIYLKVNSMVSRILVGVEDESYQQKIRRKLLLYPLILVICYLPYTVKAIFEFSEVEHNEFIFTLIAGFLRCFHSFLNFCVYGMNPSVRRKVKNFFEASTLENQLSNETLTSRFTLQSAVDFTA